jgi:hypothetical protein
MGKCRFKLFLVTVAYILEFSTKNSIILTTNITKEYIYCEGNDNMLVLVDEIISK